MKKSISLIIILVLVMSMSGCGESTPKAAPKEITPDGSTASDVTTKATEETEAVDEIFVWKGTIIKDLTEKGMALDELIIPETATEIGFNACFGAKMTKLTIGSNVTIIGDNAFDCCRGLINLTIPPSVKTIGQSAFHLCESLESITFSEGLEEIGDYAFSVIYLDEIILPDGLKTIGNSAFNPDAYIYDVYIPASVENIPLGAFMLTEYGAKVHVKEGSWADLHFIEFVGYDYWEKEDNGIEVPQYEKVYY